MEKKKSELFQTAIFLIIFAGQVFLAMRYSAREDTVGMIIFAVVAVLAAVAAFGHFLEWKKTGGLP
ncbi:MAG: hypothetical protein JW772_04520 [Candidatus Diapherotrites archaeon]|nr:hypothetical protein [Candidatus Diapherotrites archaeon]